MRYLLSISVFAICTICVSASFVWADEGNSSTRAEEHSKRGVELYAEGQLPEAVGEMLKAYELAPEPGLLYNIARIYQKMGQRDLALQYLKKFVTQPGADPDRVTKALQHLEELNRKEPAPRALSPENALPSPQATPRADSPEMPRAPQSSAALAEPKLGGPNYTPAWVLIGSGGLSLVVGGVLGALALDASAGLDDESLSYEEKRDAQSSARAMALGSDISIGVGVAAALTGLVLYLTAEDPRDARLTITPTVGSERVGAALTLRFP